MASRLRPLRGMVALVTGGLQGLGRGCVDRFIEQGMRVAVADLPNRPDSKMISETFSREQAIWTPMDITNEADVQNGLEAIHKEYGRLDAVINCAGVAIAYKTYNFNNDLPHKLDDFQRVQMVNICGTFNVCRLAAGLMYRNQPDDDGGRGVIINVASLSADEGQMGQVAFAASKGAIASMTLPMARDLASHGIRVVCLAPGLFDTPLMNHLPDSVRTYMATLSPFPRRMGRPEEFAHTCEWIIQNNIVNGEVVRIDGAMRMGP